MTATDQVSFTLQQQQPLLIQTLLTLHWLSHIVEKWLSVLSLLGLMYACK